MTQSPQRLPPQFVAPLTPVNAPIRRCLVPREEAPKRVLIMRAGAHGDILMGTPLLAALREAWPDAHLTWIVEHTERETIDAHPFLDEIIVWNGGYWKNLLRRGLAFPWLASALQMRRELHRRRYDVFVSFQPEEWPLLARGVGAPVSVGVFDTFRRYYRAKRTSGNTRLYTHAYAYPHLPEHRTDQYLLTLQALGLPPPKSLRMSMGYTAEDQAAVEDFLAHNAIDSDDRFVVLAPMTTWPSKCWPGDRYAALGDVLARQHGCRIVLIGSAKEEEAITAIARQMQAAPVMAVGALRFRQVGALLARAALVVSGDTGPMHVAAAVGAPYVALFGSTAAAWYAPLAGRGQHLWHPVPCGPCDQKFCPNTGDDHMLCMRLLTLEEVIDAAGALLNPAAIPA